MAIGNGIGSGGLNVDMNVTPLIDVLLVLLITFMVIVPTPPHGFDTQVPQRSHNPSQNSDAVVVVQILKNHDGQISYKINHDDLKLSELGHRLRDMLSVRESRTMFIKGDGELNFSIVAQVLDIAKTVGADHIGLITPKDGI